ncbi:MAG TPA: DUF262 domain-containing HNH endonuclease family protein [Hanamia sp.]|nr:DUF262 domain-containing HNH endonuclease family protein [Hanamia sp.]
MKPEEATLASLLSIEGNQWHYHIPKYQREYTWGRYNWSKLIEDIYDSDLGHYMGSVICVHEKEELTPSEELIYEVVDGQQRLTTISLMLMAIYYKLKFDLPEEDPEIIEDDDYLDSLNSIRKKLLKKIKAVSSKIPIGGFKSDGSICFLRVQPSSQFSNLEDYKFILGEIELIDELPRPKNCGNRSIYKAYQYFYDHISDDWSGLKDLLDRLNRLAFILISETSHSKAFMLFETLNNRGVPLSGIDIIKNKMLAVLEKKHGINIDDSYNEWQKLLTNLPSHEEQDRFLRQFYNAFKFRDNIKVEKVPKATGSTLIKIYESLIRSNAEGIFKELQNKAKIYNQLIEPEKYPVSKLTQALIDLERINATPSYTFLLYLFSLDEKYLKESDLELKVVELFCKYYLRRNVTDFPNTRDLDAINIDLIEQCEKQIKSNEILDYAFIEETLLTGKGKPETIENFKQFLADNLFYSNEAMARYLLAKLDETAHTREYKPDLWARNEKGLFVWTVEHIFPQGKNIPKDWIEMIGDGDKEEAETIQEEMVHSLGNLTLSGYNSKLSNYSFSKKQNRSEANIFGNKIKIGYQNGMAINNIQFYSNGRKFTIANAPEWKKEMMQARNEVMVNMILKLFAFRKSELSKLPVIQ